MSKPLNYDEFVQYIKNLPQPFCKARVESNAENEGGPAEIWFVLDEDEYLTSRFFGQGDIQCYDYTYRNSWEDDYTGSFTPIEPELVKPEVYKEGDWGMITEEARKCGDYDQWRAEKKEMIGKVFQVYRVYDNDEGLSYDFNDGFWTFRFPHYCVKKVENPKKKVTLEVDADLLEEIKKQFKLD